MNIGKTLLNKILDSHSIKKELKFYPLSKIAAYSVFPLKSKETILINSIEELSIFFLLFSPSLSISNYLFLFTQNSTFIKLFFNLKNVLKTIKKSIRFLNSIKIKKINEYKN
jgi:hypothetical protein